MLMGKIMYRKWTVSYNFMHLWLPHFNNMIMITPLQWKHENSDVVGALSVGAAPITSLILDLTPVAPFTNMV